MPTGPRVSLRIVGIVRRPLDLGDRGASGGVVVLTPAFAHAYVKQMYSFGSILRVRTRLGAADVPGVIAASRRIFKQSAFGLNVQSLAIESEGAQSAIDVLTIALWILAGVALVAGVVAIAIVLTREVSVTGLEQPTLRALGLTRRERIAALGPRVMLVGGGGAFIAVAAAIGASPLFPIGVARRADPDPGLHADWLVLALGFVGVLLVVATVATLAAVRITWRSSFEVGERRAASVCRQWCRLPAWACHLP